MLKEYSNLTVFLPILFAIGYYILVKKLPIKKAISKQGQVNSLGIALTIAILLQSYILDLNFPYFVYGLLLLGTINFFDDLFEVHFAWRLIIQFIACSFLLMEHQLFYSYWAPIMLFFIVGVLNAFNFMDGVNGMVGTYSLSILLPIVLLIDLKGDYELLGISTIIFVLGFLIFNFRTKALVWLGDSGSIAIAYICLHIFFSNYSGYSLFLIVLFVGVFLIDTAYTMLVRQLKGENVFERHNKHLYQIITSKKGVKSWKVILIMSALQLGVNTVLIELHSIKAQVLCSSIFAIILITLYLYFRKKTVKV